MAWAERRSDIVGVALVGSWARGAASLDSDIDLILLTPNPDAFRVSTACPCDAGTQSVVSRGCRVLFDPAGLLQNVAREIAIEGVIPRPD